MDIKTKFALSAAILVAVILSSYSEDITSTITSSGGSSNNNSNSNSNNNNNENIINKFLRIGYFPNLNHAQAVTGLQGDFQKLLGNNNIRIKSYVFNTGSSAIEALFGGQIDVAYVGPNPAINGYLTSGGQGLKIISGAASGGASFVVRNDSGINSVSDLGGKKFASPQLGNTQDVALRKYLVDNGFNTVDRGGNVTIVPVTPSDILTLMLKKEIDGAWVPEPWVTRLVKEANGRIFVDERELWPNGKFVTANIIARTDYLNENPQIIKRFLAAHVNQTNWTNDNKEKAIKAFNIALVNLTGRTIPEDELRDAFSRLEFTYDPVQKSLFEQADNAYDQGFLATGESSKPDLSGIYDLSILNQVLEEKRQHTE
jgi:NitT/TauT family transport system substrate-binding protein